MTSSARYFKEGVGSSRPKWRWIICSWSVEGKHLVQGVGEVLQAALWIIGRHQVLKDIDQALGLHVCLRLPTVYAGRLFLSWASWSG